MYCIQINLPAVNDGSGTKKNVVNRIILEQLISALHKEQYKVNKDYKYILGFPELTEKSFGMILHIFSKNKDDLYKHLKCEKVLRIIGDYCSFKIIELNDKILNSTDSYSLKRGKKNAGIGLSQVKRFIERKSGEAYKLSLEGFSMEDIVEKFKQNKKVPQYIKYLTSTGNIAYFFYESIKKNDLIILNFEDSSSFGYSKSSILPKTVF